MKRTVIMFKLLAMLPLFMIVGAIVFPPNVPYVTRKGTDVHERIWLWRVPAYADHPAWYIRWNWRDGLTARAYCYDPEASAAYRAEHHI